MYVNYLILIFLCNVFQVWCYSNSTDNFTDNVLWLNIVKNCENQTSSGCLKNSVHEYLKNTLDYSGDVQVMDFLKFTKNAIDYDKFVKNSTNVTRSMHWIPEDESPLEEISRSLHDNTRKFLMTHDLELQLPESLFLGGALKISPRSFDSSGAEIKFEVVPKITNKSLTEGRTIKKISEYCDILWWWWGKRLIS